MGGGEGREGTSGCREDEVLYEVVCGGGDEVGVADSNFSRRHVSSRSRRIFDYGLRQRYFPSVIGFVHILILVDSCLRS